MATTKIWPIKDSLARVVAYAQNPEKTAFADLKSVLHYAENSDKTTCGEEKTCYVTGVNCNAASAVEEMIAVQKYYGKTGGNVSYHAYQSFKTGEVTPDLCHKLGVELAEKMWGEQYQVVVATHFNTGTYHNHFVVNAVSYRDGKKFNCNKGAYYQLRSLSDNLCRAHRLSVIQNPAGKTPRSIYFAEKNGEPTRYNLMRSAIDDAVAMSFTDKQFYNILRQMGYVIRQDDNRKYLTIRSINGKKGVRLYRLGEDYLPERINERILQNPPEASGRYHQFIQKYPVLHKTMSFKGSLFKAKKITGLRALYLHFCYLLGAFPKRGQRKPYRPLSPEMRAAVRKLERYSRQVRLVCKHGLRDTEAVQVFIQQTSSDMEAVTAVRNSCYNKLRRCKDPDTTKELKAKRDACTRELKRLRREKQTAKQIITDLPEIRETMRIERCMRQERMAPAQSRKRGYIR